jgi:peptidyl-prolyl cis-trans isomerase D
MAVISKIRGRAGLLIGIIGFSLVAFILGDLLSTNQGLFSGDTTTVAVIGGKKINVQDFEAKVQTTIENYKLNSQTNTVDQNLTEQLREQTYNQLINDEVMGSQYDKLGLTVTPEELLDMVKGKNPHPQIVQAFTDPNTKQFNPAAVINFLKNMGNDPTGRTAAQWVAFEKSIQQERLSQKYNDLIKQGLYVTTAEAKSEFEARNKTANLRYVMLPYTSISDSSVVVSDAELKAVYDRNLKRYKQEDSRSIEYITFDVQPTDIDRAEARKQIEGLKAEFAAATNDSAFVKLNSDNYAESNYMKKGSLPYALDTVMFSSPVGTVVGPYEENNMFRLAKLSDSRMLPDSVQARHILLKLDDPAGKDAVMTRADSILTAIRGGADFVMLNFIYSTDEAAKMKGGDLGWFGPGMMVKQFNDAAFQNNKGDKLIVETQFGVHIMDITNQSAGSRQVKVSYVDRKIEPSSKTYQTVFNKANDFGLKNTSAEAFDKSVKDQNLTKLTEANILSSSRQVGPLENSRELVQWAFKANVGDISKVYDFNNRFTIAKLTEVREKGYSTLEQVKDQVMFDARREKKAKMIAEKITKAGNASNLDALAAALGTTALSAENISFASPFLGSGMEGRVVGKVMTMKEGAVSAPIDGTAGVYVVSVVKINMPQAPANYNDIAAQMRQQTQSRAQYEVFNALREKADITDNRIKFY